MATLTVGPQGEFSTLASAIAAASPGDTILLQNGLVESGVFVSVDNLTFFGTINSGAAFTLASGVKTITLQGEAAFRVGDEWNFSPTSSDNTINGNDGNNIITIHDGVDVVHGGLGTDQLNINYGLAASDIVATAGQVTEGASRSVVFDGIESFRLQTGKGNDTFTIGDGNQFASMGAGNDTVVMGVGEHEVYLGDGNNQATLGNGNAKVYGGDGDDVVFVGDGTKSIFLYDGNNQATLGKGNATVQGGRGNDVLLVGDGTTSIDLGDGLNHVTAGNGANQISTGSSVDTIIAGHGANVISSGNGNDSISAGNGGNTILSGDGDDSISTGDGNDRIDGGTGNDSVSAGGGNDVVQGGRGKDILNGGAGDDELTGGNDDDVIAGGMGNDTASYADAIFFGPGGTESGVNVSLLLQGQAQDTRFGLDTLSGIENLRGSSLADTLVGNAEANSLEGMEGDDTLTGGSGADVLLGGAGRDRLVGGGDNDLLFGGSGADVFRFDTASDSNATLYDTIKDFESGIDKIDISALAATGISINRVGADSFIFASTPSGGFQLAVVGAMQGSDLLTGGIGIDIVDGDGNGVLIGTAAADRLYGVGGNDQLRGGAGNDQLFGDTGADELFGDAGADQFAYRGAADSNATDGFDIIKDFVSGTDKIDFYYLNGLQAVSMNRLNGGTLIFASTAGGLVQVGLTGNLQGTDLINPFGTSAAFGYDLVGDNANDTFIGSSGNDRIYGVGGNDQIRGGTGDDQLFGDTGADELFGEAGADQFAYRGAADSNASDGYDIIKDFVSGTDKIDLYYLNGLQAVSLNRLNGGTILFASTAGGLVQVGLTGNLQGTDILNPFGTASSFGYDFVGENTAESFIGSAGNDRIFAGGGADTLQGGLGSDLLAGGTGADIFKFAGGADSNANGYDTITDFETGIDKIDLRGTGLTNVGIAQQGNAYFVFANGPGVANFQLAVSGPIVASDILTGAAASAEDFLAGTVEPLDTWNSPSDASLPLSGYYVADGMAHVTLDLFPASADFIV